MVLHQLGLGYYFHSKTIGTETLVNNILTQSFFMDWRPFVFMKASSYICVYINHTDLQIHNDVSERQLCISSEQESRCLNEINNKIIKHPQEICVCGLTSPDKFSFTGETYGNFNDSFIIFGRVVKLVLQQKRIFKI